MMEVNLIDNDLNSKEYFEKEAELVDYKDLDERNYQLERRRTEILMDLLNLRTASDLLDVGCGDGLQLNWIHEIFPHINLSGIDISEKRIERAAERVPSAKLKAISAAGDGLGFEEESFDRAICSEVIEHLQRPDKVLNNVYDVLKKGGLFVVSVPYREKVVTFQCMNCGKMTAVGHINSFDESKISSMLEKADFDVLSVRGYSMAWVPFVEKILPYPIWLNLQRVLLKSFRRVKPYYLIALAQK